MALPKTHEILPGRLWLRGRTNHLSQAAREELRRYHGFHWVVACCPQPDYAWQELGPAVSYRHWPFADGPKVPLWIEGRARLIVDEILAERPVLIYCNAGRNRSALMAALVVEAVMGITGEAAVSYVRNRRPGALANLAFVSYLEAEAAA